ncbi:MAG: T9SS type A sorting domain-containing protein [Candidatus Edwardsbacteria bacterium]
MELGGLYLLGYSPTGVEEEERLPEVSLPLPKTYSLSIPYPNPSRGNFRCSYAVPTPGGRIVFKLYDVTGRMITVLKDGQENPGYHTLSFSRETLATGVYFLRMSAPGGVRFTKKMIVLR